MHLCVGVRISVLWLEHAVQEYIGSFFRVIDLSDLRRNTYLIVWFLFSYWIRIKEDDRLIQAEGVESLSETELREDCRERGMLGILSVEEMRQQVI